jgi:transcriptional regulator with XRE-family HTH domain
MKKKIINEKLRKRIGKTIATLRQNKNMDQLELALKSGYSHASGISQIETGLRNLYMDDLVKIAKALDVDVSTIINLSLEDKELNKDKLKAIQKFVKYVKSNGEHLQAILALIDKKS